MKPREDYRIMGAMFDVRPVDESGYVDVVKIKEINPVVDLSHLKKPKKLDAKIEDYEKQIGIAATVSQIRDVKTEAMEELEASLNETVDTEAEFATFGGMASKPAFRSKSRLKPILAAYSRKEKVDISSSENLYFESLLKKIQDKSLGYAQDKFQETEIILASAPRKDFPAIVDVDQWWNSNAPRIKYEKTRKSFKFPRPRFSRRSAAILTILLVCGFVGLKYGLNLKRELVQESNSAVQNLETAKERLTGLDFAGASDSFSEAYQQFAKADQNLNFLGAGIGSLLADFPGAGKLKSANNLVQAGKLVADAGKAMSEAISVISKTSLIFNPSTRGGGSMAKLAQSLKAALLVSSKDIKSANTLLAEIDELSLPDDKKQDFIEFKTKLPEFEKLISSGLEYANFLENITGAKGLKRYVILFQNPAELRPTGGFPGSYGVIEFEDGILRDFRVDDVYNLDGQLKENIIPPVQLQHITPTWGMRDASWFIDFPTSAKKVMAFYKKESGQDADGVITLSPELISGMLGVLGPIEMPEYKLTINGDNFTTVIQNEVEYGSNRSQPKKILVDLTPKLLKKIYSASSDEWLNIFNMLVGNMEQKGILMYFKDISLQSFAYDKGFSGHVNQADGDYLMVTLTNVKGSKTDSVTDNSMRLDTKIDDNSIIHTVTITRKHNGGTAKYGFYNKQNPAFVRVLVPEGSEFMGLEGNDKTDFAPLIDYSKSIPKSSASGQGFVKDDDLSKLESTFYKDDESGAIIYREAGKTGFGFWLVVNPGQTKTIKLTYSVPRQFVNQNYELYIQKQPGLIVNNFEYSLTLGPSMKATASSPTLNKIGDAYILNQKLEDDLQLKIRFE